MIEKFQFAKHKELTSVLPFSYFTTPVYLDAFTYIFKRNNETIFAWPEDEYPHDFPAMFMPKNEKNWERARVYFATKEDMARVKKLGIPVLKDHFQETEYFYNTKAFISPSGPLMKRVKQFKKKYTYTILNTYDKKSIIAFYEKWHGTKNRRVPEENDDFFLFCLKNLDKYSIRQVYVEIDKKLVGLAWGVQVSPKEWVGLHLKVDYEIDGLSRFLHLERANMFKDVAEFSLGTGCDDPGIRQFKKELKPIRTVDYQYLLTENKPAKESTAPHTPALPNPSPNPAGTSKTR